MLPEWVAPVAVCSALAIVNITLNLVNGFLFHKSDMKFPLTLTVFHMVFLFGTVRIIFRFGSKFHKSLTLEPLPPSCPWYTKYIIGALTGTISD